jgi:hypothetical protein
MTWTHVWAKGGPRNGHHEVSVEPLREAFLASGRSAYEVALALGWTRLRDGRRHPDSERVKRQLGITPYPLARGRMAIRQRCTYARAVEMAEAIGVDPVDVDL